MHSEMEDYIAILDGQEKAESTIDNCRRGLEQFSNWLEKQGFSIEEVTPRDVKRYLAYLKNEHGYASSTIRVKFVAVSQFYTDLTENGYAFDDPTDPVKVSDYAPPGTKRAEITKQKHVWMEKEEVQRLVEHLPAPKLRNRLAVLLTYYTGLRRQEVVNIKLDDLDRENRMVTVRGKGEKNNTAYWQPKLDGLLTAWLDGGYRNQSPYARESDYLLLTESTPQLSPHRLSWIVREGAKNAGIQEVLYTDAGGQPRYKYTAHTLRHSFAMHYLQNGGSIEGLSKLLAHSDIETTQKYGEILDERAQEEYEKYAPDIDF